MACVSKHEGHGAASPFETRARTSVFAEPLQLARPQGEAELAARQNGKVCMQSQIGAFAHRDCADFLARG
jgi:hypothetical protein